MNNNSHLLLVSVIVTNYNYSHFLTQSIESVLGQTYQNFELIVVDDGSTDDSPQIIESYKSQIRPIFQKNAGQGAAINAGIKEASGEIVCLLDADDIFEATKLQDIVSSFESHPTWVQIAHTHTLIDEQGSSIGRSHKTLSSGNVRPLLMQWGKYGWTSTSGLSFRAPVLRQVLPVPPKPNKHEITCVDTYLTATVPFCGDVGYIKKPLMRYRLHGKNLYGNVNLRFLMHEREFAAQQINAMASIHGIAEQFDLENDADYCLFRALESSHRTIGSSARIIWLNFRENLAVGRSFRDSVMRLIQKSLCLILIEDGRTILSSGVKTYLKNKLFSASLAS